MSRLPIPADPAKLARQDISEQIAVMAEQGTAWLRAATDLASVSEAKARAAAVEVYVRQIKAGRQAEHDAATLVLWAKRRQGQLLDEQKRKGERRTRQTAAQSTLGESVDPPTLADQGITKAEAEAARKLAQGTDEEFEAAVLAAPQPSQGAVIRELAPDPVADAETEARAATRRLRDEVTTLADRIDKLAEMGDAPSSLALLLDAPESKGMEVVVLDAWSRAADEARNVLDRWSEQLARAKGKTK